MQICECETLPKECDVAIIGGGPTGSSAANKLASQGFDVVLFDKVLHPRNAVGESLIPHFWRYADQLGVTQEILDQRFVTKSGMQALWGNKLRRLRFAEFGYKRPALHVERDVLDNILLRAAKKAGAQVFEGVRVTTVDGLDDPVATLSYTQAQGERGRLRARYVIDASGQAAVVARQLNIRVFDEALRFSAFWGYYRKSRYLTYEGQVHEDEDKHKYPPATLISATGEWGWAWNIVMRETTSVGLILPKSRLLEMRGKTQEEREERFRRHVENVPLMGRLLDSNDFIPGSLLSIRDYAYKPVSMTAGNCFLAGDAAAFVDPINSLGLVFAMFSGTFAAHAISRSLKNKSEAQVNRELYAAQLSSRIALFRLLALPEGVEEFSREEIKLAKAAIGVSSDDELRLIAFNAGITLRDGAVKKVFSELGIPNSPKIESMDWRDLQL